jgi:hypothetical protein
MKELVDRGVYQYDDLQEAINDAQIAADDSTKVSLERRRPQTMYVLQDTRRDGAYYGPVNNTVRQGMIYREMEVAYTAEPTK